MLGEIFKMYVPWNKKCLCIHIMTLLYKPLLLFLMNNIYTEQGRIWHHKKISLRKKKWKMSTQRVMRIFVFLVERSNGLNLFYSYNSLFYFAVAHSFYISNYFSLRGLSNCSFLLLFSHLGFSSVKPGNLLIQHFILSFLKWELSSIYTFHLSLRLCAYVSARRKMKANRPRSRQNS